MPANRARPFATSTRPAARPHVIVLRPNRFHHAQTAGNEQRHLQPQFPRHERHQRLAVAQTALGAIDFHLQRTAKRVVELAVRIHFWRVARGVERLLRQIDAVLGPIARHVLAEIHQLQPGADRVGQRRAARVMAAAEIKNQPADRIGRSLAIIQDVSGRRVTRDVLILAKRGQQSQKRLARNRELVDRAPQRHEHRMLCRAGITPFELVLPPIDQRQPLAHVGRFVGQVVGPTAKRVNRAKMRQQSTR